MNGYAKPVLVDTAWLAGRLGADGLVVAEASEHPGLYREGHIAGAVELHWRRDLQDPIGRDVLDARMLELLLGRLGIGDGTTVVLYGDKSNCFAAYVYWYLKLYGHEDVRMLDGGRQKWLDDGGELTTRVPAPARREYHARGPDESIRARRDEVLASLGEARGALVDARSPAEYRGELLAPAGYEQEGAERAGRIPGAISIPWAQALRDDGTLRDAEALRALYAAHGVTPERSVTVYCRNGQRSAHTWLVLRELLGYEDVRNYDGSWTEWGSLVGVPVARG